MKANKLDHLCIAVKDLDAARKIWEPIPGKSESISGCQFSDLYQYFRAETVVKWDRVACLL